MPADVLTVNAGSTSVKLARWIGGRSVSAAAHLQDALNAPTPEVVVHRVVHGGPRFSTPVVLDDAIVAALRELTELAPLHQPPALDAIDRCRAAWPRATQVACFDTAFHATLPEAARTYALPARLRERVRVYGFHGLSCAWASGRLRASAPGAARVLIAHLGGGQSLCGVDDGRSVVTTMGLTPLDGLVMATRSGALDPGAVLYLTRTTDEDVPTVLETESGFAGLAGTGDLRAVLQARAVGDAGARLAIEVWLHRFTREAGGCAAVLGGLDAIVFTGGAGEQSATLRWLAADRLRLFGVELDAARNDAAVEVEDTAEITAAGATVRAFVVHAREDLQMLHEAEALLASRPPPSAPIPPSPA